MRKQGRKQGLDVLRGLTMISMIAYHTLWDIHYIFGMPLGWYVGLPGYVWQQSICWTFILLSGYLAGMGQHKDGPGGWNGLKDPGKEASGRQKEMFPWRGLQVFGCGALITVVTILVMPQDRVVFGVLTLLGSCKLIVWAMQRFPDLHKKTLPIPLPSPASPPTSPASMISPASAKSPASMIPPTSEKSPASAISSTSEKSPVFPMHPPYLGLAASFAAFTAFRHTEQGWLGIPADPRLWFAPALPASARGLLIRLPGALFCSNLTAYLGFPQPDFFSTDYFPLLPWFFLFMSGYFLYSCIAGKAAGPERERGDRIRQSADRARNAVQDTSLISRILMKTGRHSLLIYMLHQPVIYGILLLVFRLLS